MDHIGSQDAGELADELFTSIDDNSDGFIDGLAAQATRGTFRGGLSAEAQAIDDEMVKLGIKTQWVRSCAFEKDSCQSCEDADGQPIDPDDDLTMIHEGPPDTCECRPVEEGF